MEYDDSYQGLIKIGNKNLDYYDGLLMRADSKLHGQITDQIEKRLPKNARILDFGCGQGALSIRLAAKGYNLLACDQNVDDFKAKDKIPYYALNFNDSEAVKKFMKENHEAFDAVLGIEVIEHVENPWQYIRDLKSLVKPGGHIIISTPNVSSWFGRMVYLLTGQFPSFFDPDLVGHINPITPWELSVIANKTDLKEAVFIAGGELPILWISGSVIKTLLSLFFLPIYPFARGLKLGWCTIAIFKK